MKFFEDIQVGNVFDYGRYTFTAEAIKAFAVRYDPQAFHVDEAAAERSHFGALVASGWHTALAWMRLMIDYRRRMDEAMLARGEQVAGIGPALGDAVGVPSALMVVAAVVLLTLPLTLALRPALASVKAT